jgi:hypothetical protein
LSAGIGGGVRWISPGPLIGGYLGINAGTTTSLTTAQNRFLVYSNGPGTTIVILPTVGVVLGDYFIIVNGNSSGTMTVYNGSIAAANTLKTLNASALNLSTQGAMFIWNPTIGIYATLAGNS